MRAENGDGVDRPLLLARVYSSEWRSAGFSGTDGRQYVLRSWGCRTYEPVAGLTEPRAERYVGTGRSVDGWRYDVRKKHGQLLMPNGSGVEQWMAMDQRHGIADGKERRRQPGNERHGQEASRYCSRRLAHIYINVPVQIAMGILPNKHRLLANPNVKYPNISH